MGHKKVSSGCISHFWLSGLTTLDAKTRRHGNWQHIIRSIKAGLFFHDRKLILRVLRTRVIYCRARRISKRKSKVVGWKQNVSRKWFLVGNLFWLNVSFVLPVQNMLILTKIIIWLHVWKIYVNFKASNAHFRFRLMLQSRVYEYHEKWGGPVKIQSHLAQNLTLLRLLLYRSMQIHAALAMIYRLPCKGLCSGLEKWFQRTVEGTKHWGPSRKMVPECLKGSKTTYTIIAIAEKQSKRSKKGPYSLYIRSPRSHPGNEWMGPGGEGPYRPPPSRFLQPCLCLKAKETF